MEQSYRDSQLGNVFFGKASIGKMNKFGLKSFHIIETIKYGQNEAPLLKGEGIYQRFHIFDQMKQVTVVFTLRNGRGVEDGTVRVLSCWAWNIR